MLAFLRVMLTGMVTKKLKQLRIEIEDTLSKSVH